MAMLNSVQSTYFRQLRHPNFIASTWPLPPSLPPSHNGAITQRICPTNLFPLNPTNNKTWGLSPQFWPPCPWWVGVCVRVCVCGNFASLLGRVLPNVHQIAWLEQRYEWKYVQTQGGFVQISRTWIRADTNRDMFSLVSLDTD